MKSELQKVARLFGVPFLTLGQKPYLRYKSGGFAEDLKQLNNDRLRVMSDVKSGIEKEKEEANMNKKP